MLSVSSATSKRSAVWQRDTRSGPGTTCPTYCLPRQAICCELWQDNQLCSHIMGGLWMTAERLLKVAETVRKNAYAPYSNFPVSCVVMSASGDVFSGVNVENASYSETLCAEANAIGALVSAGERAITEVLVLGGHPGSGIICTPCGGCRQRLTEFASPETLVHLCDDTGIRETVSLSALLPRAFGPGNIAV